MSVKQQKSVFVQLKRYDDDDDDDDDFTTVTLFRRQPVDRHWGDL